MGAHSGWLILDEEFLGTFELDINNVSSPDILELDENNIIQPSNQSSNTSGIVRFRPHIYSRKNNLILRLEYHSRQILMKMQNFMYFQT